MIEFINSEGILEMIGEKKGREHYLIVLIDQKRNMFFNPSFHIIDSTIFPI